MKHFAAPDFWTRFEALPSPVQRLARKNFKLLKRSPDHPSLHFKTVGRFRSVRVGLHWRALGTETEDGILWWAAEAARLLAGRVGVMTL